MLKSRATTKMRIAKGAGVGRFTPGGMSVGAAVARGATGSKIAQAAAKANASVR